MTPSTPAARRRRRFASLVVLFTFGIVPLIATPAHASCAELPPMRKAIREAPAVFVGTVVHTENMGRWVIVDVSEVWKGDVEPELEVRAGPKDPPGPMGVASSVDRHYRDGETYLFLPYRGDGKVFGDNSCTRTTLYRPQLDRFKPAGAFEPTGSPTSGPFANDLEPETGQTSLAPWLILGALIGVFGLTWLFVRSRRSS